MQNTSRRDTMQNAGWSSLAVLDVCSTGAFPVILPGAGARSSVLWPCHTAPGDSEQQQEWMASHMMAAPFPNQKEM